MSSELSAIAARIATTISGPAAASVDRDARFPHESIAALRAARMLSVLVPRAHGGAGASITDASSWL